MEKTIQGAQAKTSSKITVERANAQTIDALAVGANPKIIISDVASKAVSSIAIDQLASAAVLNQASELMQTSATHSPSTIITYENIYYINQTGVGNSNNTINFICSGASSTPFWKNQQTSSSDHPHSMLSNEIKETNLLEIRQQLYNIYQAYGQVELPFETGKINIKPSFIQLSLIKKQVTGKPVVLKETQNLHTDRLKCFEDMYNVLKDKIELEKLFCKPKISSAHFKRVLVYGRAGIGKSTLLKYLAYNSTISSAEENKIFFYLPLRLLGTFNASKVSKTPLKLIAKFIRYCLGKTDGAALSNKILNEKIIMALLEGKLIQQGKIVKTPVYLLLDGLDEARHWLLPAEIESDPSKLQKASFCEEILRTLLGLSKSYDHITTLLSTRPMEIGNDLYAQDEDCQIVETMGFNNEAMSICTGLFLNYPC